MIWKLPSALSLSAAILSLGLSGCGQSDAESNNAPREADGHSVREPVEEPAGEKVADGSPSLADAPDVCFRAVARHLGADTKVSEITSFFSAGSEIDGNATEPQGKMIICKVDYQNPQDPRKLLSVQMDVNSGTFGDPRPVEITVAGGNAAEFNIEDYLIPLSKVNAAALVSVMDGQKAKLGSVYGRHAWSGVRLSSPGAFSNTHTLRLDLTGRLASNDIKQDGYASVTIDGKTIKTNYLVP